MMGIAKIYEIVGSSSQSWDDAVRQAVEIASKTDPNIKGAHVQNMTAKVVGGKVVEYRAAVKLSTVAEG